MWFPRESQAAIDMGLFRIHEGGSTVVHERYYLQRKIRSVSWKLNAVFCRVRTEASSGYFVPVPDVYVASVSHSYPYPTIPWVVYGRGIIPGVRVPIRTPVPYIFESSAQHPHPSWYFCLLEEVRTCSRQFCELCKMLIPYPEREEHTEHNQPWIVSNSSLSLYYTW